MKEPYQSVHDAACDVEDWPMAAAVKYASVHGVGAALEMWPRLHNRLLSELNKPCPTAASIFAVAKRDHYLGRMA